MCLGPWACRVQHGSPGLVVSYSQEDARKDPQVQGRGGSGFLADERKLLILWLCFFGPLGPGHGNQASSQSIL